MLDFIPSEYYRKYCEENGIEFSDREKAAIIWQCPDFDSPFFFLYKKLETLKNFAAETDDEELKAEIGRLLIHYEELDKEMKDNDDNSSIYDVFVSEFISNFEEAFQRGLELSKEYKQSMPEYPEAFNRIEIVKVPFYKKPTLNEPSKGKIDITYDHEGRMLNCDFKHSFFGEILSKNYVFKHPFKSGDIVMDVFTRKTGVVHDILTELPPLIKIHADKYQFFIRLGIRVIFITSSKLLPFQLETICPAELEKLDNFDKEGHEADMLRTAAEILREAPSDIEGSKYTIDKLYELTKAKLKIMEDTKNDNKIFADDKED